MLVFSRRWISVPDLGAASRYGEIQVVLCKMTLGQWMFITKSCVVTFDKVSLFVYLGTTVDERVVPWRVDGYCIRDSDLADGVIFLSANNAKLSVCPWHQCFLVGFTLLSALLVSIWVLRCRQTLPPRLEWSGLCVRILCNLTYTAFAFRGRSVVNLFSPEWKSRQKAVTQNAGSFISDYARRYCLQKGKCCCCLRRICLTETIRSGLMGLLLWLIDTYVNC